MANERDEIPALYDANGRRLRLSFAKESCVPPGHVWSHNDMCQCGHPAFSHGRSGCASSACGCERFRLVGYEPAPATPPKEAETGVKIAELATRLSKSESRLAALMAESSDLVKKFKAHFGEEPIGAVVTAQWTRRLEELLEEARK